MAKAYRTWTVLPHGPIQKLTENLWRIQGDLPDMPLKRVMTVARRSDGGLVIHNGIALEESAMAELDAFGPVRWLLVPNGYHRLDAPAFKARYPAAKVLCPRGARAKVQEVVPVDGDYHDLPTDSAVSLQTLAGTSDGEGVMIVRSHDDATLVFNDIIFNMPHVRGFSGLVLRYLIRSSGGPRISRLASLLMIKDRGALREHLTRLAETPDLHRIIVSHHQTVIDEPAATLRGVAQSL